MKAEVNGYSIEIPDPPVVDGWEAVEFRSSLPGDFIASESGLDVFQTPYPAGRKWIMRCVRKTRRVIRFVECEERTEYRTDTGLAAAYLSKYNRVCHVPEHYDKPVDVDCWLRREDLTEEVEG